MADCHECSEWAPPSGGGLALLRAQRTYCYIREVYGAPHRSVASPGRHLQLDAGQVFVVTRQGGHDHPDFPCRTHSITAKRDFG